VGGSGIGVSVLNRKTLTQPDDLVRLNKKLKGRRAPLKKKIEDLCVKAPFPAQEKKGCKKQDSVAANAP